MSSSNKGKKKVLVHIGMGKTGSSSIQSMLSQHEILPFDYPMVNQTGHQNIEVLFREYKSTGRGIKSRYNESEYQDFKSSFKKSFLSQVTDNRNLVISAEYLFNFKRDEILNLKNFLVESGFTDFLILLYVRAPESYYLSAVQQRLKASFKIENPEEFKVNYKKNISRWADVFGIESLQVREFSKTTLVASDVIKDFADCCNTFFDTNLNFKATIENSSLSAIAMCFLQRYRKNIYKDQDNVFKKDSSKLVNLMLSVDKSFGYQKPKLKKSISSLIMKNHFSEIEYLKFNFGIFLNFDFLSVEQSGTDLKRYESSETIDCSCLDVRTIFESSISELDIVTYSTRVISKAIEN